MSNLYRGPSLGRKHIWQALYKDCSFSPDPLANIVGTGNSCWNSVLGQMERLSIKCFFRTSCFSSYCEPMHIILHVHHWNKNKKIWWKSEKNWCLTIIFPHKIHKIWDEICDLFNFLLYYSSLLVCFNTHWSNSLNHSESS
jgi:hypothetical protein